MTPLMEFSGSTHGKMINVSLHFCSNATKVLNNDNAQIDLSESPYIFESFDAYLREGSVFDEVIKIDINLANYVPLQG